MITQFRQAPEPIAPPVDAADALASTRVNKPSATRIVGLVALVLLALTLSTAIVLGGRSEVEASPAQHEADFIVNINELRVEHGLNTLILDDELTAASRDWAIEMAVVGDISHAPAITAGITQPWLKVGENVGMGGDVVPLMDAFIASPTHYENLIDPAYTHVGVGVIWSDGTMFTTHRFMSLPDKSSGKAGTTPVE